jgi:hypothetical protein
MTTTEVILIGGLIAWMVCAFAIAVVVELAVARRRAPRVRVVASQARTARRPQVAHRDILPSR